jgi:ethanolamine utilization cobalamin adenosyltransferase
MENFDSEIESSRKVVGNFSCRVILAATKVADYFKTCEFYSRYRELCKALNELSQHLYSMKIYTEGVLKVARP